MKKAIIALMTFFYCFVLTSYSQDIIYKKDGSKVDVKVLEVSSKEISFKMFSNLDGPVYKLDRAEVMLITYENGQHEVITSEMAPKAKPQAETKLKTDFAPNIFAFHLFDVVFGDIGFSYERITGNGMLGIKIPIGIGIYGKKERNDVFNYNNVFYTGFGINFYPGGQGRARYFIGPQFRFGKGIDWHSDYNSYNEYEFFYLKYMLDNGLVLTPVKNLSISFIGSVGIRVIPNEPGGLNKVAPTGQFAINMGFRF